MVQKLNFFYGTKYKWVDVDGLCAAGHEETEVMYRDYRIDTLAWMVVKDSGFYQSLSDFRGKSQSNDVSHGNGGANTI